MYIPIIMLQISIMGNIPCCEQEKKANESEITPSRHLHEETPEVENRYLTPNDAKIKSAPSHSYDYLKYSIKETKKPKEGGRGPQNYQSRKYLGKGAFGCVVLAEEKETGKLYAMKIIQKAKIKEFNLLQCELIKRIGNQQFMTSIRETFQNQTHIYIIMEYLPMGDLYFYLKKKEIAFTENVIRGIIAEIVVGIGVLHDYGLIYRELKPQNLLITKQGHIKLTDYGLSKVIIEEKQSISTFVGTLQYMAPQALDGEFGQKADIWSLGVLMYELMFRENPFEGDDRKIELLVEDYKAFIQKNLINEKINAKIGYMSLSFRDLLVKILEKNPQKRISLQQIRSHDFFKDIDWVVVEGRGNEPPLSDIIEKHDFINYRDATNEEYIRKAITRHQTLIDNYEIKLYQFRNSH